MLDGNSDSDKPGIEEMYQVAGNTSNLTVEADRRGAGDVIIAAGWSASRIGMALLRLHSEFDASEQPTKPSKESIAALIGTFQRTLPGEKPPAGKPQPLNGGQAFHFAFTWHAHEVSMLLGKLKALPAVREQLTIQALRWGMGRPVDPITRSERTESRGHDAAWLKRLKAELEAAGDEPGHAVIALERANAEVAARRQAEDEEDWARAMEKASATIRYWLDQTCTSCHGLKWQLVPGAPALSNRPCRPCSGGGFGQAPNGQEGRKLANFMDDCVSRARSAIGRDLSNMRTARNKVLYKDGGYVIMPTEDGTGC
jgi:hypothetical protein